VPAEDLLVVGTSQGLLIRDGVRAVPALHLSLGVIYEGNELALVSEVHPVRQSLPDVPGSLDPWCRLQDDGNEHQRLLGVPSVGLNAAVLRREDVDEAAAHSSFWNRIVGAGEVRNPPPAPLPCGITADAAV
jgi:hypothetical protein